MLILKSPGKMHMKKCGNPVRACSHEPRATHVLKLRPVRTDHVLSKQFIAYSYSQLNFRMKTTYILRFKVYIASRKLDHF